MNTKPLGQATCPGCDTTLHIPTDWAGQKIRCLRCGTKLQGHGVKLTAQAAPPMANNTFQPSAYAGAQAYPTAVQASAYQAPVYAPTSNPFDMSNDSLLDNNPVVRRRRKGTLLGTLVKLSLILLITGGLAGAGIYFATDLLKPKDTVVDDKEDEGNEPSRLITASQAYPRRMLVMNVSNYLYCNALTTGQGVRGTDQVTEVAKRLAFVWHIPMTEGNNQFFILSDNGGPESRPMLSSIIRQVYTQFCMTSRPQDRVVLYFGGHATSIDGRAYLVPVDGELTKPETLIPLTDLWARLEECPAQQKVMLFDVCRINEDGDRARPGSEPMSPELFEQLSQAPKGVQVVVSCSPGQNALEYRRRPYAADDVAGSLFWSSMRHVANKGRITSGSQADQPIPVTNWVAAAQEYVSQVINATREPGAAQVASVVGSDLGGRSPDLKEPPASAFAFSEPPAGISASELAKSTDLIRLPMLRGSRITPTGAVTNLEEPIEGIVPFSLDAMKDYTYEGPSPEELLADPGKFPIRTEALLTLNTIRDEWKAATPGEEGAELRDRFVGDSNDQVKAQVLLEQETPATISFYLNERIVAMDNLVAELPNEKSKFWRATFEYARAQAKARVAFIEEYNAMLGNIRTDALPDRDLVKGETGLQLVSVEKLTSEKSIKNIAQESKTLFDKITQEHPGTPWAVRAKRSEVLALGLRWEPYVESAPAPRGEE